MNKYDTFLTDADGVLVDYMTGFQEFMLSRGHQCTLPIVKFDLRHAYHMSENEIMKHLYDFNHSELIATLPVLADADQFLHRIKDSGRKIVVVTSLSDCKEARSRRIANLENIFGTGMFEDVICLPLGSCKEATLTRWALSDIPWVEDNYRNAIVGSMLGLDTYLVDTDYNQGNHPGVKRVSRHTPWEEISANFT